MDRLRVRVREEPRRAVRRVARPTVRLLAVLPALAALLLLTRCSAITLPREQAPEPEMNYVSAVAAYIKKTFKNTAPGETLEISGLRWVHSYSGWSWLACVRFQDRGQRRAYAVFIKDGTVINGRYAVQTDACNSQNYAPFDLTSSMAPIRPGEPAPFPIVPMRPGEPGPLY